MSQIKWILLFTLSAVVLRAESLEERVNKIVAQRVQDKIVPIRLTA